MRILLEPLHLPAACDPSHLLHAQCPPSPLCLPFIRIRFRVTASVPYHLRKSDSKTFFIQTSNRMRRFCPVLASTARTLSFRCARTLVSSSPSCVSPTVRVAFIQCVSFAKKSGGKVDATADTLKAAAGAGQGKSPKSGSKNADSDSVNAESEMEAIIAIMKCEFAPLITSAVSKLFVFV